MASITLRGVAKRYGEGLETVSGGEICFGDRRVTDVDVSDRDTRDQEIALTTDPAHLRLFDAGTGQAHR